MVDFWGCACYTLYIGQQQKGKNQTYRIATRSTRRKRFRKIDTESPIHSRSLKGPLHTYAKISR